MALTLSGTCGWALLKSGSLEIGCEQVPIIVQKRSPSEFFKYPPLEVTCMLEREIKAGDDFLHRWGVGSRDRLGKN